MKQAWKYPGPHLTERQASVLLRKRLIHEQREAQALDDILRRVRRAWAHFQNWQRRMDKNQVNMTRNERNAVYAKEIGMD